MVKEVNCKSPIINIDHYSRVLEFSRGLGSDEERHAGNEKSNKGVFTTLIRIKGSRHNVVPVKSSKPLDKKLWLDCSKALSRLYVGAPIKAGDIVCKNILNTGSDIICTKNID